MHAQVCKLDNYLVIRIPDVIATQAFLKEGMTVEIDVIEGRVLIAPVKTNSDASSHLYDLNELVAGVASDNLHDEVDTGNAVGCEVW